MICELVEEGPIYGNPKCAVKRFRKDFMFAQKSLATRQKWNVCSEKYQALSSIFIDCREIVLSSSLPNERLAFRHFWNWVFLSISRSTLNCSNAFCVYFETCSNKHQHWHQHQYWHRPRRHLHTSNKRPDKARQKAHNNLVPYILTLVHCIGYSPLAYL